MTLRIGGLRRLRVPRPRVAELRHRLQPGGRGILSMIRVLPAWGLLGSVLFMVTGLSRCDRCGQRFIWGASSRGWNTVGPRWS